MVHQVRRSVLVLALLAAGFLGCSSDTKVAETDAAAPQANTTSTSTTEVGGCCGGEAKAAKGCGDACVGETGGGCCAEEPKN